MVRPRFGSEGEDPAHGSHPSERARHRGVRRPGVAGRRLATARESSHEIYAHGVSIVTCLDMSPLVADHEVGDGVRLATSIVTPQNFIYGICLMVGVTTTSDL